MELFIFRFYPDCSFGKFVNFAPCTFRSERVNTVFVKSSIFHGFKGYLEETSTPLTHWILTTASPLSGFQILVQTDPWSNKRTINKLNPHGMESTKIEPSPKYHELKMKMVYLDGFDVKPYEFFIVFTVLFSYSLSF